MRFKHFADVQPVLAVFHRFLWKYSVAQHESKQAKNHKNIGQNAPHPFDSKRTRPPTIQHRLVTKTLFQNLILNKNNNNNTHDWMTKHSVATYELRLSLGFLDENRLPHREAIDVGEGGIGVRLVVD